MKITELKNLGLTEKEAKIYMACLELGYASIQGLARKAGTNRVAVYAVIEDMKKRGLINTAYKGKRKVYVAEKPGKLLDILKDKYEMVKEEISNYKTKMLPELISIYNQAEDKPRIRYYDAKEGVEVMRDEILRSKDKMIYSLIPITKVPKKYRASESFIQARKKAGKNWEGTVVICRTAKDWNNYKNNDQIKKDTKVLVTQENEDIDCEIISNDGKVYVTRFSKHPFVLVIEDVSIANIAKYMIKYIRTN